MNRKLIAMIMLVSATFSPLAHSKTAKLEPIILDEKPHIQGSFTQGLLVDNGEITETSGGYGESYVVRYDVKNNRILQKMTLPRSYFAEGITQVGNKLYMLTWKEGKLFVLRAYSFEFVDTLNYTGEGWGIAYDGTHFITSDGSSRLAFRDFNTFEVQYTLGVYEGAKSWSQLNELEFAQGLLWANVFQSSVILAIDPLTGQVVGKADMSELVKENNHTPGESVLNGIAYDESANGYWITGKLWPKRYLVHFIWNKPMVVPPPAPTAPANGGAGASGDAAILPPSANSSAATPDPAPPSSL